MSGWRFQFKPALALLTLLLVPFLASLGFWQLSRATEKRDIVAALTQKASLPVKPIADVLGQEMNFAHVSVRGQALPEQFLIDNKFHQHKAGYHVITPVKLAGHKSLILLNRGWVERLSDRKNLPDIALVSPDIATSGMVYFASEKGFTLSDKVENPGSWPRVLPKVDYKQFEKALGMPVYPFLLLQDDNTPNGYVRQRELINMPPEKHQGYAVQWFAMALTMMIIFVALSIRKKEG